jgi:uncharacterized membrane protein HdeD (DUF308 family)
MRRWVQHASKEHGMGYVIVGIFAVIAGISVALNSDTPGYLVASEVVGLLILAAGVLLVMLGVAVHVAAVNRAGSQRP